MTAVTLPAHSAPATAPTAGRAATAAASRPRGRRGPNATLLRVEFGRAFASPRRMVMAIGLPVALSLAMNRADLRALPYGHASVAAMVMVGMALYGAAVSTSATGAAVSIERASGWTRQLRLTPLSPLAYIATKSLVGLLQGGLAVAAVMAVAIGTGNHLPWTVALASGVIAWLGSGCSPPTDCSSAIWFPRTTRCRSTASRWRPLPCSAGSSCPCRTA